MADNRELEILLSFGVDSATANKALQELSGFNKQVAAVQKQLDSLGISGSKDIATGIVQARDAYKQAEADARALAEAEKERTRVLEEQSAATERAYQAALKLDQEREKAAADAAQVAKQVGIQGDYNATKGVLSGIKPQSSRENILAQAGLAPEQVDEAIGALNKVERNVNSMQAALEKVGLPEGKAKAIAESLKEAQNETANLRREAQEAITQFRKLSETGVRIREIGTVIAATGASILAPALKFASDYETRFKGFEAVANNFAAAQYKQEQAVSRLGRTITSVLTPSLNSLAEIMEKVASFAEKNPALVQGVVNFGIALTAVGGIVFIGGQILALGARLGAVIAFLGGDALLAKVGTAATTILAPVKAILAPLATAAATVVVTLGALAVGLKGGEFVVNQLGKAIGNAQLENFKLVDALKTVREIIGLAAIGIATAFSKAVLAAHELQAVFETVGTQIGNAVATFVDGILVAVGKAAVGVQEFVLNLRNAINGFLLEHKLGGDPNANVDINNAAVNDYLNASAKAAGMNTADFEQTPEGKRILDEITSREADIKSTVDLTARNAKVIAYNADLQRRQLDADAAANQKDRTDALALLKARWGTIINAVSDWVQSTIQDAGNRAALFGNTGTLGKGADDFFAGISKTISELPTVIGAGITGLLAKLGVVAGGGDTTAPTAGTSPEAAKLYIQYQQQQATAERAYRDELANINRDYRNGELSAERSYQDEKQKAAIEEQRQERDLAQKFQFDQDKAQADFNRNEVEIAKKNAFDKLQREREAALKLTDLAAARDVAGFIQEQRRLALENTKADAQAAFDARERKFKFDAEQADKKKQYEFDLQQLRQQARDKQADADRQYEIEKRNREIQHNQQLEQQRINFQRQQRERDIAFAVSLADLQDNIDGLKSIRDKYYADQLVKADQFYRDNAERFQQYLRDAFQIPGTTSAPQGAVQASDVGPGQTVQASYASGTPYVPKTGLYELHQGERVLTAAENRAGGRGGSVNHRTVNVTMPGAIATQFITPGDLNDGLEKMAHVILDGMEHGTLKGGGHNGNY